MITKPLLSILIPTVNERDEKCIFLEYWLKQITEGLPVEILTFKDNRTRSIGAKRNALVSIARGQFIAFVDDDDTVSKDYATTICDIAKRHPDVSVISFRQDAEWNGQKSEVHFSVQNEDQPFNPGGITKRFPWHSCAWNASIAKQCLFSDKNWGEDADFVRQLKEFAVNEAHIPRVLHYYKHEDNISLATELTAAQKQ